MINNDLTIVRSASFFLFILIEEKIGKNSELSIDGNSTTYARICSREQLDVFEKSDKRKEINGVIDKGRNLYPLGKIVVVLKINLNVYNILVLK